jgi:hypothetical protein
VFFAIQAFIFLGRFTLHLITHQLALHTFKG